MKRSLFFLFFATSIFVNAQNWFCPHVYGGLNSIQFLTENIGYTLGSKGVYKTDDGGVNWNLVMNTNSEIYNTCFFLDQDTGYIASQTGILKKTTNGGVSWTSINITGNNVFKDIYFTSPANGFLLFSGGLVKTTNYGANWSNVSTNATSMLIDLFF